jgi:hypothetical protein
MLLAAAGIACLIVSGLLLLKMSRDGAAPRRDQDDMSDTLIALSQFSLMAFGLALVAKGIL